MEPLAGLHHVSVTVSDLDESAAWYGEVLGLVEAFRESSPKRKAAVFCFVDGGFAVGLVEHVGSGSPPFDPTVTGLDHFALSVGSQEQMRQWSAHLDRCGVDHSRPIEIPPGEILNFKDPDGIAIALFWDNTR